MAQVRWADADLERRQSGKTTEKEQEKESTFRYVSFCSWGMLRARNG
jgi:hypothetical protein